MKKGIWIVVILSLSRMGAAQDSYQILQQIEAAYQVEDYLSFQADFAYYSSLTASKPSHTLQITSHKKGEWYYMEMEGYVLFGDGKVHLHIDHDRQVIQLLEGQYDLPGFGVAAFKEMAETVGLQLREAQAKAGKKVLLFSAPATSKTTIRLSYDPINYYLHDTQWVVDVDAPNQQVAFNHSKMEVKYSQYHLSSKAFPYHLEQFVQHQGKGQYQGRGKYRTYQIENL